LGNLLQTEPNPLPYFDATLADALVNPANLAAAPNATLDQIAMQLGPGAPAGAGQPLAGGGAGGMGVPFGAQVGAEPAAAGWSIGPVAAGGRKSSDLIVASDYKYGVGLGQLGFVETHYRFPVLVSWDFTCTDSGGFERLMNDLDVGLLGTLDAAQ